MRVMCTTESPWKLPPNYERPDPSRGVPIYARDGTIRTYVVPQGPLSSYRPYKWNGVVKFYYDASSAASKC